MPYWRLFYHIVWATRGRKPLISERIAAIVTRSVRTTCNELDVIPHALSMMPDHLHVAASIPPKVAVAELVRRPKGASSHAVNTERTAEQARFGWQREYGVISFGERSLPRVAAYIHDQRVHRAEDRLWPVLERITDRAQPV